MLADNLAGSGIDEISPIAKNNVDRIALCKNNIMDFGIREKAEAKGLGTEACQICLGHFAVLEDLRSNAGAVVPLDLPEFHFQGGLRQFQVHAMIIEFDQLRHNLDLMESVIEGEVDEIELFQLGQTQEMIGPETAQIVIVANLRPCLNGYHMVVFVVPEMDGNKPVPEVDAVEEVDQVGAEYLFGFLFNIFNGNSIGGLGLGRGGTCFHGSFDE